jgi:hypothetical protein
VGSTAIPGRTIRDSTGRQASPRINESNLIGAAKADRRCDEVVKFLSFISVYEFHLCAFD